MEMLHLHLQTIYRLIRDERAATAVEYAMIAAGISAAIIATVMALGTSVKGLYEAVQQIL